MSAPIQPPFLRETTLSTTSPASAFEISGFESATEAPLAATKLPTADAPADKAQKHRARDLFIRGVLTEDQMKEASASMGGFEAIIGKVDFLPAYFLEQGVVVSRATCLIKASGVGYNGIYAEGWTGTGFLISGNILVTNNHVLNSRDVAASGECVFNYQKTVAGLNASVKSFRLRPDILFITSPAKGGLDYTFVAVDGDPAREFGSVPVTRKAFEIAPTEYANVISHPDGRPKQVSIKENEVKWQDKLVVHYASDTMAGSSGSAVANNMWQLVALHHASQPSTVAGFPILNEGIKFSAIAADLENRVQAKAADAAMAARVLGVFDGVDERLGFFGTLGRPAQAVGSGLEQLVNTYQGGDKDIDVGFWNVEWLSNRYEGKAAAVAQVIYDMRLDVWCLEESSPNGIQAVVAELKNTYDLDFDYAAAEPDAGDNKQSCTLLWNKATVEGDQVPWGEPAETWISLRSTEFDQTGLEAVHGKIFDRYPALFRFRSVADAAPGKKLDFHIVPLHLKAMDEGSLRRRMASKIIAAAVNQRLTEEPDSEYIIGGDFNAEIASQDFDALSDGGLVAVSAEDEANGVFTYLKRPHLSLIDHIYLSPNLAVGSGAESFFVVAADSAYPDYIQAISDHRPIVFRMSLGGGSNEASGSGFEGTTTPSPDAARLEAIAKLKALWEKAGVKVA
jgi:V8-like Glu-specific endopeptidase